VIVRRLEGLDGFEFGLAGKSVDDWVMDILMSKNVSGHLSVRKKDRCLVNPGDYI
jgi:hypothetical protein